MLNRLSSIIRSDTGWSLYGQACFLIANFSLFLVLMHQSRLEEFGTWAIYVTVIAIVDSLRQGLIQNGLIRSIVQSPDKAANLVASSLLINYTFIGLFGFLLWISGIYLSTNGHTLLSSLLKNGWITLAGIGSLQYINVLWVADQDYKKYFVNNLLYLVSFSVGLGMLWQFSDINFIDIIRLQMAAAIPCLLHWIINKKNAISRPLWSEVKALLQFGKYVAGTNILSMLFHKADVLMLAIFVDPTAVALFHFASKIVGYAELPLNALSQVIYPRLSASYRSKSVSHLKPVYLRSILSLLTLALPMILIIILLNKQIITLLSTNTYMDSSSLIVILCLGGFFKPIGRVFGLTLDAMGMPRVNFQMLSFSLVVNVVMNLLLIPAYGVAGAAIATSSSIVLTVIWGQVRLRKWLPINIADIHRIWRSGRQNQTFAKTELI